MKLWRTCGLLSICLLTGLAWAQDAPAQTPLDAQYLMRPGDTIAITVWRQAEYTVPETQIRPDGKVTHPRAGEFIAAGKTPVRLAEEVKQRLLRDLVDPMVTVSVTKYREDWVFVAGAVANPGPISMRAPLTVQQAVASAGGLTATADLVRAVIITPEGKRQDLNLDAELKASPDSGKLLLDASYTLLIPETVRSIVVLGAVARPGMYPLPATGMRVSDAIATAGGLAPDADAEGLRLTRSGQQTVTLNARQISDNANDPGNIALAAGDALYVPNTLGQTFIVLGEVAKPGVLPLIKERATRLSDALALAGGLTTRAEGVSAKVMRLDGSASVVDLARLLAGAAGADPEIRAGDTVFIPQQAQYTVLGAVRTPGRYSLQPGSRFSDAIALAGGLPESADAHSARLMRRDGTILPVDTQRATSGLDLAANPVLQDGDTLVVDLSVIKVAILGDVAQPGLHPLRRNARVSDAIAGAGGLKFEARRAILSRPGSEPVDIDLLAVLENADATANSGLVEGDTLYVLPARLGQVAILGAVRSPGTYPVRRDARLSELIAQAGGLPVDTTLQGALVVRRDGSAQNVRAGALLAAPGGPEDVAIAEGDTVIVTAADPITVLGAVKAPGVFPMLVGARISAGLARAGGGLPEADLRSVSLVHKDGSQVTVDLRKVLEQGDAAADVVLQGGDVVLVPGGMSFVSVLGAVASPGRYSVHLGSRFSDAIALAGGLVALADAHSARLARRDGTSLPVDTERATSGLDLAANPVLQDGDTLVVDLSVIKVAVLGDVAQPGLHPLRLDVDHVAGEVEDAPEGDGAALGGPASDRLAPGGADVVDALAEGQLLLHPERLPERAISLDLDVTSAAQLAAIRHELAKTGRAVARVAVELEVVVEDQPVEVGVAVQEIPDDRQIMVPDTAVKRAD